MALSRAKRLQIMLTEGELKIIRDWRFAKQMPSVASAIRELIKRGLAAEGFMLADRDVMSKDFGFQAKSKRKPAKRD
jgi:hypothetical protein